MCSNKGNREREKEGREGLTRERGKEGKSPTQVGDHYLAMPPSVEFLSNTATERKVTSCDLQRLSQGRLVPS